uniref:NADH dehydrogenase [ubiquinone] 1 beta subcomplex subunit 10 n=1 Tax=Syphacia muris TaxID=451379 RepID=A0A0N5ALJ6_9BILA
MSEVLTTSATPENNKEISPSILRRLQNRKEWEAYWTIRDLESRGTYWPRITYYVHRAIDFPATWFRERIAEPLHDKYRLPYYHRKLNRVPEIDQCGVNDQACYFEANEQYRLDKMVDWFIMQVLKERMERCTVYNKNEFSICAPLFEEVEEAELNFFIKYGELGSESDVKSAYMKQKHRMIWERRHPEIMKERERAYEEHKKRLAKGDFDMSFWKKGLFYQDKKNYEPPYELNLSKATTEGDKPLSKDWEYYKKVKQDPEFDKEQGKTSSTKFFF